MHIPITALYAGLNGLLMIALAIQVVRQRLQTGVIDGSGDQPLLIRAQRAHANNIEYVPYALVLLAVLEINGISAQVIYGLGTVLTLSRVAHAQGMLTREGQSPGRTLGSLGTWAVVTVASFIAVWTWQ